MTLLPVSTTRTSTPLSTQRLLFQLNADQLAIQRQYDQLSSGRRLLRISDDPAAAGRAITLQRSVDRTGQLVRNAQATESFYQATDQTLGQVDDALIAARGVAVEGAQNVLSTDEREALALSIRQSLDSVFAAGNAMLGNHQLLGGILENENSLQWDNGGVVFTGSDAVGQTKLGSGTASPLGINGTQGLGVMSTFVEGEPLGAALDANTRLVDMRSGQGVKAGVIRISDGSQWHEVDLRTAATIGDVADVIESIEPGGRSLSVTINDDSLRVEYTDGLPGTLAIADAKGSSTASDLGVENADGFNVPPLIGTNLTPRVTTSTKISELDFGSGIDLTGGLRIAQGEKTFEIDLSEAQTLGDVLITINRSGADVRAELDEAEGRIDLRALRSGVDYSIGENGGVAARSLGIRSATEETRLSQLGRGQGVSLSPAGADLTITRPDGVELALELEGAETIQDVIDLIRDHPDNQDMRRVLISLNRFGNGLQLNAPPGADPLRVSQSGTSDAGVRLGLIPPGSTKSEGEINGAVVSIVGRDYLPREAGGALDTLLRLETAIREGDLSEIGRLQQRVDDDLSVASRMRGRVGVWNRNLEQLRQSAESDSTSLQAQLSGEVDADMAKIISDLSQRQMALEASMQIIGQTSQLTVLNYL